MTPGSDAQTRDKSPLRTRIAQSFGPYMPWLILFSVSVNLLILTGPIYMLQIYDRVLLSGSGETLGVLTLLVAFLFIGYALLESARTRTLQHVSAKAMHAIAPRVFDALHQASVTTARTQSDRALQDLASLRQFGGSSIVRAGFDLPVVPLYFVILFMMGWQIGLVAVAGAAIISGIAIYAQAKGNAPLERASEASSKAAFFAQSVSRRAETVRALGMLSNVRTAWLTHSRDADQELSQGTKHVSNASSLSRAFRLFLQSALLGTGAALAINGHASAGTIIAASIIGGRAITPIEQCIGQWQHIVKARSAWHRINDLLSAQPPAAPQVTLPPIQGAVNVQNLYAAPPGRTAAMLHDVSFEMAPGEAIAIIGPSGAGKTSLMRVLTGTWPILLGSVRLDGSDLSGFPQDTIGQQIGYLPQQIELFPGSVAANIARMAASPDSEKVIEAAKAAQSHELILSLPNGYDTYIDAGITTLSAGQRQRIGLARALYQNPKLVILDEPNANLDHEGEESLAQTVIALKARGASTIIIGHRPTTVRHVDRIIVMEGGRITGMGPRQKILEDLAKQRAKLKGQSTFKIVSKKDAQS